jgi:hypothetical protein
MAPNEGEHIEERGSVSGSQRFVATGRGPSWETTVAAVILNIFPLVTVFGILAFQLDRHAKRG